MTVADLIRELGLEVFCAGGGLDAVVEGGYTSDLLSDVMGHADSGRVWITLQAHKNVVAIASLKDLAAVIIVKGFKPDPETLELASREGVVLLGSAEQEFELSGKIYALLNS